jgi:oligopeptide transport system ATP-binding protein
MSGALLQVDGLVKHFPIRAGVFSRVRDYVRAVDGVSFEIPRGKTLALVGESGSGKTTVGRCMLRLHEPTAGRVIFDGVDITQLDKQGLRAMRKRMQLIFQDPYGSLNPRMTVYAMIAEVLRQHSVVPANKRRARVEELLELVGLTPAAADRYPHEFSGGQRQRLGIARALAVEPDFIIADEPVSALDVSVQAQILNLMEELQERLGLTYLFVGHDLTVIRHIADFVAVMYLGRIVESGTCDEIFENTHHPYTRALLSAAPTPDPREKRERIILQGDVPSPINPPPGCPFHPRCPDALPECARRIQVLTPVSASHSAACHVHVPVPELAAP